MASFYLRNAWWLGTGVLFMFASSFGQTYFISLFAGDIRAVFGLSNGEWGGLYTLSTLASAACLMRYGRLADTLSVARLVVVLLPLYALAAFTLALAPHVVVLALAVFGLRFCGQGMMGHVAMTAMARWFRANRAKAVSVAVLGFPLGEALLPAVTVYAIGALGWRETLAVVGVMLLALFLPALRLLTRHGRTPQGEGGGEEAPGMLGRQWTRGEVLRHFSFWAVLPGMLAPPFIGTCAVFHQVHLAAVRGWELSTMAFAFTLYAAVSVGAALALGPVVDRVGPTRLLPVALLPLCASIAVLAVPGGVEIWFVVLAGIGFGQGLAITLSGSLWPALYGTRWIGSVRSITSAAMVTSTALGPGITGLVIDLGVPFPDQALALSAYCLAVSVVLLFVAPRLTAMLPRQVAA